MEQTYWNTIKDNVIAFGDTFNNITIKRNLGNNEYKEIKVPIAYSNGSKYIERYLRRGDDPTNIKDQINITVPRLGFKLVDLRYDPERRINRCHKILVYSDLNLSENVSELTLEMISTDKLEEYTTNEAMSLYTPVPYILNFELYVLTNMEEDSNQIIEQILPKFTPDHNIGVTYTFGPASKTSQSYYRGRAKIVLDSPLTLEGFSKVDSYDGTFETKSRTILHTFTFSLRCKFFRDFNRERIIKILDFNFLENNMVDLSISKKLFAMPTNDKLVIDMSDTTNYENFYQDMYQDPFDITNTNVGDQNGMV